VQLLIIFSCALVQRLRRAKATAVDGETIRQHAAVAALAAQKNIALPESSDSGLDDRPRVGTVTRVLRAFKALSSPYPPKQKKARGKRKSDELEGQTGPSSKGSEQDACPLIASNSGESGERVGKHSTNEGTALSEEEKRARKKAKKLRQKQQHKDDAEHAAKEKAKREKKKARAKAAKQAREPKDLVTDG
jgi:hypothetical protein